MAVEKLLTDRGALEAPVVPTVTFQGLADGAVHWQFEDAGFSGIVPPPAPEAALKHPAELASEPGYGRIDVTVRNRFGSVVANVSVVLSGRVSRDVQTDADGRVAFEKLPHGRYDLVAKAPGPFLSMPRLIDLDGRPVPAVEVVLKPALERNKEMMGCGFGGQIAPESLAAFAADSDAVLQVRVERQRTFHESQSPGSEPEFLWTASALRLIKSFKNSPTVTSGDELIQFGGHIDRGEYIELGLSRKPARLNIGDEYVLFLKRYEGDRGRLRIHHVDEGAFLLRNGRVTPLGSQTVARAWKGGRVAEFLEALHTLPTRE